MSSKVSSPYLLTPSRKPSSTWGEILVTCLTLRSARLCDTHVGRALLKVMQVTNISPQVEEGFLEGVRR